MKKIFLFFILVGLIFNLCLYAGCSFSDGPAENSNQTNSSSGSTSADIFDDSSDSSGKNDSSSDDEPIKIFYVVKFYDGDWLVSEQKIEEGDSFKKPSDLKDKFDEYEFIGWQKENETDIYDFSRQEAMIVENNIIFIAKWKKIEYTPWVK